MTLIKRSYLHSLRKRPLAALVLLAAALLLGGSQPLAGEDHHSPAPPPLSRSDKSFLRDAAEQNQAAIELGQVAEQKGFSASARNFARVLVAQRSRAQQELLAVARRVHLGLPLKLSRRDRKTKQQLEKQSGAQLDRTFLARMAEELDRQYGSYEDMAMSTRNPAVKAYIESLLSEVKRQDQVAKTMAPEPDTNSGARP